MPPIIITDENEQEQRNIHISRLNGHQLYGWRGYKKRTTKFGAVPGVPPATFLFPRIPRSEWVDRILEGKGTFLHDLTAGILPPHDQGTTNFCWAHGSVRAVEALRVYQGQSPLILSAESVAVPVTGGRNRGGSAEEALEQLSKFGCCRQEFWPNNDLNIRHAKTGWEADAIDHVILKWADIENFEDQVTLALHRIPVAIGLDWWGHLVCQLDPVILPDGSIGIGIDNSWGPDWGENGYGILDERHGTADGAFAPISESFSG